VVVFFPSFAYLDEVSAGWHRSGAWERLRSRKVLFQEPREAAAVESLLTAYAAAIAGPATATGASSTTMGKESGGKKTGGAILLAVVGGKMAEGINFGDGLGRYSPASFLLPCSPYDTRSHSNIELM
jgi:chromosome transmission fidelity protein 1